MVSLAAQNAYSALVGDLITNTSAITPNLSNIVNVGLLSISDLSNQLGTPIGEVVVAGATLLGITASVQKYNEISRLAASLMNENMSWSDKALTMYAIIQVPFHLRENVIREVSLLIQENPQLSDIRCLIKLIDLYKVIESENIRKLAAPLIRKNMTLSDKTLILLNITNIAENNREDVVTNASFLITPIMNVDTVQMILKSIEDIDPNERFFIVRDTAEKLKLNSPDLLNMDLNIMFLLRRNLKEDSSNFHLHLKAAR